MRCCSELGRISQIHRELGNLRDAVAYGKQTLARVVRYRLQARPARSPNLAALTATSPRRWPTMSSS
jgi:hypothetical protein